MGFVAAKCTSCGGVLKVDESRKEAICEYCGSAYIVQEAINNYNITNVYNIEKADFTLDHKQYMRDRLESAEKQIYQLNNYAGAIASFHMLRDEMPEEYRVWKGLVIAKTANFDRPSFAMNVMINEPAFFYDFMNDYSLATRTGGEEATVLSKQICSLLKDLINIYNLVGNKVEAARKKNVFLLKLANVLRYIDGGLMLLFLISILPTILIGMMPIGIMSSYFSENPGVTFFEMLKNDPLGVEMAVGIVLIFVPMLAFLIGGIATFCIQKICIKKAGTVFKKAAKEAAEKSGLYYIENFEEDNLLSVGIKSMERKKMLIEYVKRYFS